jgi:hypothetical protein
MVMLRAEAAYVRMHRQYREAYRSGIWYRRRLYGEPLIWQAGAALKSHDWYRAHRYLSTLMRFYPGALALPLLQKWSALAHREVVIPQHAVAAVPTAAVEPANGAPAGVSPASRLSTG